MTISIKIKSFIKEASLVVWNMGFRARKLMGWFYFIFW